MYVQLESKKKQKLRNNEYYNMQSVYDELYQKAKEGKTFNSLMEIITCENNILLAYRNIKSNTGSETAGTDGKTIEHYKGWTEEKFVRYFQNKLAVYIPQSVRRVEIPKEGQPDKTRPLVIPCMDDRIIQQCIKQVLEPVCEANFHPHSYGFRPNRGTDHAIARATYLMHKGFYYVIDIDIKGFFDNVNHGKLLKQMWTLGIRDKNLICVISKILKSEIEGIGKPEKGTPQGGIISPLLSNIVLNELDWWLSNQWETIPTKYPLKDVSNKLRALKKSKLKEFYFVRYADDFKILCKDCDTARKIFMSTQLWLKERLGLEISPEKSKITNTRKGKTEFLGFKILCKPKGKEKVTIRGKKARIEARKARKEAKNKPKGKQRTRFITRSSISVKALCAIQKQYKEQIKRIQKQPNSYEINKLNAMILGWHNYYRTATLCSIDFGNIAYKVSESQKKRLRNKSKNKEPPKKSKTYEKFYGGYNIKTPTIANITIFPLAACTYKIPTYFTQATCNYTEAGRKIVHDKLVYTDSLVIYLLNQKEYNKSVEYNDNRISLIAGQQGKCGVTNEPLTIGDMECHHIKPLEFGGTDEYKNLKWVRKDVHKLIHATIPKTIKKYLDILNLDTKALKKVDSLRKLAQNLEIKQVI